MKGVQYRLSKCLEYSTELVELLPNKYVFGDPSDPRCMVTDSRLRLLAEVQAISKAGQIQAYKNYVATFCEMTNETPHSLPGQYAACGFLPVGVEPECMVDTMNHILIIPKLHQMGLEYFLIKPLSPVSTSYKPLDKMASTHDVWVSKMEAAKVVHKPIHNISTLDLLEVILPS